MIGWTTQTQKNVCGTNATLQIDALNCVSVIIADYLIFRRIRFSYTHHPVTKTSNNPFRVRGEAECPVGSDDISRRRRLQLRYRRRYRCHGWTCPICYHLCLYNTHRYQSNHIVDFIIYWSNFAVKWYLRKDIVRAFYYCTIFL